MTAAINLTDKAILTALKAFLSDVLASGTGLFSGSIAGTVLTVASLESGSISEGDELFAEGIEPGTLIGPNIDATTWNVSISQNIESAFFSTGIAVIQSQQSRIPELRQSDYVVMTPPNRSRLETNMEDDLDVVFSGSIANDVMTVLADPPVVGVIKLGATVFGPDVAAGSRIVRFLSGTGEDGTYKLSVGSQDIDAEKMSAGSRVLTEGTEIEVQLDIHGPQGADTAQIITTTFRDSYAAEFFAALDIDLAPLYGDEALQVPFPNKEQQWENRWVVKLRLQANPQVSVSQQFADQLTVETLEVDAEYPVS